MKIKKVFPLTLALFFFFSLLGGNLTEVYAVNSSNQVQIQETSENTQEPTVEERSKSEEREEEEYPVEADLLSEFQKKREIADNLSTLPILGFTIFLFVFFMFSFVDSLKKR